MKHKFLIYQKYLTRFLLFIPICGGKNLAEIAGASGVRRVGVGKVVLTRQGYHHSDETKEKIRQKHLSGNYSGKKNARSKPVHMLSLNDEILQTFESCCLAAKSLNVSAGNINTCANGKAHSAYGHKWKLASKN